MNVSIISGSLLSQDNNITLIVKLATNLQPIQQYSDMHAQC